MVETADIFEKVILVIRIRLIIENFEPALPGAVVTIDHGQLISKNIKEMKN